MAKYFRTYLFGRKFTINTSHRHLTWPLSIQYSGSRLARCRFELDEYNYKVEHKPGNINENTDVHSKIKNSHIHEVANFQTNISLPTIERRNSYERKLATEFNRFVELYKFRTIID